MASQPKQPQIHQHGYPVLKQPGKLPAPTAAQIANVTDVLEHRWASNALMVQDRYTQSIERDDHNAASKWALAGAISTDKILVLKGRPTEIIANLHAHRHDMAPLMDKLASAARSIHSFAPPFGPVPSPQSHPTIIVASIAQAQSNDALIGECAAASHAEVVDNRANDR